MSHGMVRPSGTAVGMVRTKNGMGSIVAFKTGLDRFEVLNSFRLHLPREKREDEFSD